MKKVSSVAVLAVGSLLGFSQLAHAAAANGPCNESYGTQGGVSYETMPLQDGSCVLELDPASDNGLTYRSFLFDNRGGLMIFNSTPGPEATSNGARSYFFFPRKFMPSFQVAADGTLSVTSASGIVFNFSDKTEQLVSVPSVSYTQDPVISMTNNGGVNITAAPGVWLDTGWMVGGAAYQVPTGHSTLHSGNVTCDLTNSELFNIVNTSPVFKFTEDKDFAAFLLTRCPGIDVSSLQ
jgi:hypothetical protein